MVRKPLCTLALCALAVTGVVANPEITVDLPGGATMAFVRIEPGTFVMGTTEEREEALRVSRLWRPHLSIAQPAHEVTITQGFYLGKYEITQGQWEAVMGTTPWSNQGQVLEDPDCPASYLSWEDVHQFVQRMNTTAEDSLYRMPTEAEWEFACRAATTTIWSFGDDAAQLGEYAWFRANTSDGGEGYAHQAGTRQPNPWGLYDMHGNMAEWVQDWYAPYSEENQEDPQGPPSGSERVFRSGYYYILAPYTRSAFRYHYAPDYRGDGVGARLLRMGPPNTK